MPDNTSKLTRFAVGSVIVGVVVLALKYIAYHLTGSVALLSDALESIVNVATAIAALVAVRLAQRPADAALPYGYYKVEYFSAVIEGALIVVAALLIFREAYNAYMVPRIIDLSLAGLSFNAVSSVINGAWCWLLIRAGRKYRSPAISADGRHLLTDVLSSVGVLGGILVAKLTGWQLLDPLLAVFVALNILWAGWRLIKESVGGLMDIAVAPEELNEIRDIISASADGAIEAHDIRTRQAGRMTFIEFHLVVPAAMTVAEAHDICDRIEMRLKEAVRSVHITIHVEPEDKAKHSGIVVL